MNRHVFNRIHLLITFGLLALTASAEPADNAATVAESAEKAVPLAVGARAPGAALKTADGAGFDLGQALKAKPTVLIFYRGGWCPFCNTQLAELQTYQDRFVALGYQILALSTDAPEAMPATVQKHSLSYTLLSDRAMNTAQAYGVAWRVSSEAAARYATRGIQLAPIPGGGDQHWLPVPSVFIIGRDGVIKAVFSDPNFKVRPPAAQLLTAAEEALK